MESKAHAEAQPPLPRLLSDPVPRLRADVTITPSLASSGLFDACLRGSARTFALYDFEVSIARMLNGRRAASELIEAAGKIGIPVSLESLGKFIRQLHAYGFISEPSAKAPDAAGEGAWTPRSEWKPEVRELFQSALRTFRIDRLAEAREYLEALLQIEAAVPEAIALLTRIEERLAEEESAKEPSFLELHGPPGSAGEVEAQARAAAALPEPAPESPLQLAPESSLQPAQESAPRPAPESSLQPAPEFSLQPAKESAPRPAPESALQPAPESAPRPAPESALQPAPEPALQSGPESTLQPAPEHGDGLEREAAPDQAPPSPPDAPPRRPPGLLPLSPPQEPLPQVGMSARLRARWPAFAVGIVIASLLAVLGVPVPFTLSGAVELLPRSTAEIVSPGAGEVAELLAAPGAWVEERTPLLRIELAGQSALREAAEAQLAALEERRKVVLRKARTPKAAKLQSLLRKREAELARLEAARDRAAAGARAGRGLPAAEKAVARKAAEVRRALAAHRVATGARELEALEARQEEVAGRLAELEEAAALSVARAGAAGRFDPAVKPGDAVAAGQVLGHTSDLGVLVGRIAIPAAQVARVPVGQSLTIHLSEESAQPIPAKVSRVPREAGPGGLWFAELELENADRALPAPSSGIAIIHCDSTPLLAHLLDAAGL